MNLWEILCPKDYKEAALSPAITSELSRLRRDRRWWHWDQLDKEKSGGPSWSELPVQAVTQGEPESTHIPETPRNGVTQSETRKRLTEDREQGKPPS